MSQFTLRTMAIYWVLAIILMIGGLTLAHGEEVPAPLSKLIEEKFPGAVIHEVDQERYKGQMVTEIELTAQDGIKYEVYVSEMGEIVKIEEED